MPVEKSVGVRILVKLAFLVRTLPMVNNLSSPDATLKFSKDPIFARIPKIPFLMDFGDFVHPL